MNKKPQATTIADILTDINPQITIVDRTHKTKITALLQDIYTLNPLRLLASTKSPKMLDFKNGVAYYEVYTDELTEDKLKEIIPLLETK